MLNLTTPSRQRQYRRCLNYFAPLPYTTTERDTLRDKIAGMIIWNTDTTQFEHWDGSSWIGGGAGGGGTTATTGVTETATNYTIPTAHLSTYERVVIKATADSVIVSTEGTEQMDGDDTKTISLSGGVLELQRNNAHDQWLIIQYTG